MRLLVVGEPRSGKTTWCKEYVDGRRRAGLLVGGILSPAVNRQGQRAGFNVVDLLSGREIPFARLTADRCFEQSETVGNYTVSREGIAFACGAIERAVESRCDLVVIDEVGPLELSGKGLIPAVELALASPVSVLIVVRSSLRKALEKRFPECAFTVVAELTRCASSTSEAADRARPETMRGEPSKQC